MTLSTSKVDINIDRVRSRLGCATYTQLKKLYHEYVDSTPEGKLTAKGMRKELVAVSEVQELYGRAEA